MNTCKNCNVPIPDGETLCDNCAKSIKKLKAGNETLSVGDGFRFGVGFGFGMLIFIILLYGIGRMIGAINF